MTDQTPWHFLLNPAAGRGSTLRRWQKWEPRLRAVLSAMTVTQSTAEAGMAALAEAAVRAGHTHLVGVGGDGTHHDILNGIITAGGLDQVTYAPLPLGTGNDWVRTLGTPRKPAAWLAMLRAGKTMAHGVGRLVLSPPASSPSGGSQIANQISPIANRESKIENRESFFLNVAGLAYDAEVVRRSESARFRHRFLYPFFTLFFLRDFTPPTVRIDYDGHTFVGAVHTVNFGIGRYSGGGMRLVPQADPTGGRLALTFAKALSVFAILANSWRFYTNTIGRVPGVTVTHADTVTVTPLAGRLEVEADGEWLGAGRVSVGLLEGRLKVVV